MSSIDLLGPANAPGAVTSRPGDTRAFGTVDTFFKDCSSPLLDDGTEFQAAWYNQVLAVLRALARGNGQTAGAIDIVTQNNADDNLVLKAVQHLIQRGQPQWAVDTGAANAMVIAPTPAVAEYTPGLRFFIKTAAAPTGPTTLNASALGNANVYNNVNQPLSGGEWVAGQIIQVAYDGANFQLVWIKQPGAPIYLNTTRDYYINSVTGSNSNDGLTPGTPWATLAFAAQFISRFNLNGFNLNMHVANGGYASVSLPGLSGTGKVNWIGNLASPASCVITGTNSSSVFSLGASGQHTMDGFRVTASGAAPGDGICGFSCAGNNTLVLGAIDFGPCVGAHISASQNALVSNLTAGCLWTISGGCSGNALEDGSFLYTYGGKFITNSAGGPAINVPGPITLAGSFVEAHYSAFAQLVYASLTGGGNVTGRRFLSDTNSNISVAGGGASYYPGTIAGVASSATFGSYT
jgi:hypothetical protein